MLGLRLVSFFFLFFIKSTFYLTCSRLLIPISLKPVMTNSEIKYPGAESSFIMDHHPAICPWHTPWLLQLLFCAVRHAGSVCHHRELPLSFHTGRGDRKLLPNRGKFRAPVPFAFVIWKLWK